LSTVKWWSKKSAKLVLIVAAVFAVSLVLVINLQGKQTGNSYFVDSTHPDASDDGEGTEDRPWKSLQAFYDRTFSPEIQSTLRLTQRIRGPST